MTPFIIHLRGTNTFRLSKVLTRRNLNGHHYDDSRGGVRFSKVGARESMKTARTYVVVDGNPYRHSEARVRRKKYREWMD